MVKKVAGIVLLAAGATLMLGQIYPAFAIVGSLSGIAAVAWVVGKNVA